MYGLPKIHKNNAPLRPIISAIGTYNYKLAKYLVEILTPLLEDSCYILKDTFDFVNRVTTGLQEHNNVKMTSFDVASLFTNIPTDETIEIILDKTHDKSVTRKDLKKLLEICVKQSHFQFNGKFYEQIDGVSMGSPLGPLFANIFMDDFENKHMNELKAKGVKSWYRYVDDIFATIDNQYDENTILSFLNNQHKNIKFTIEMEEKNTLPFLDTRVIRSRTGYSTTIYRKHTFSGVYLNWTSLTSRKYKIGLIYCLCDRIWKICQSNEQRMIEVKKLKAILTKNEYPDEIIDKEINKFTKRKETETTTTQNETQSEQPIQPSKQKRFLVLPYANKKADVFASKLTKLVTNNFPDVDFKVAFKAPNEIGKMFPFKDNIKETQKRSLVIYKIKCETCEAEYIGKTKRILKLRIEEHNNSDKSAVHLHRKEHPTHKIDANNIEILDKADTDYKLRLKEILHIGKHKPSLNIQLSQDKSQFNSELKTLIIARQ